MNFTQEQISEILLDYANGNVCNGVVACFNSVVAGYVLDGIGSRNYLLFFKIRQFLSGFTVV